MRRVRTADVLGKASDDELIEENDANKTKLEYWLTAALPHRDKNAVGQQERKDLIVASLAQAFFIEKKACLW